MLFSSILRTQTEKSEWQMAWGGDLLLLKNAQRWGWGEGQGHVTFVVHSLSSLLSLFSFSFRLWILSSFLCSVGYLNSVLAQLLLCLEALNYSTVVQTKRTCFSLQNILDGDRQRSHQVVLGDRFHAVRTYAEFTRGFFPQKLGESLLSFHAKFIILC